MMKAELLVVADVNTIWRARPFIALGAHRKVLGLAPLDVRQAWRAWRWPFGRVAPALPNDARFTSVATVMLPGWASILSRVEQPRLWRSAKRAADMLDATTKIVVVTIPHYLPLLEALPKEIQTLYYASDDYRGYAGWSSGEMAALEKEVIRRVNAAVFVSRALANRACVEQPTCADKIHVSMNATEQRFFAAALTKGCPATPTLGEQLRRPILGIIGTVNDRLDYELLNRCASLERVGTLLFVGPVTSSANHQLAALRRHPKCRFVGEQPHATIPSWMHFIDVALIPYKKSTFNYFCSPMRLFDHLATGKPIVATDACDQIRDFAAFVEVGSDDDFVSKVEGAIDSVSGDQDDANHRVEVARDHTWTARATALERLLSSIRPPEVSGKSSAANGP